MNILITVIKQKLRMTTYLNSFVSGSQEFVRFTFRLPDEWDGLLTFAQFRQGENAYNVYLVHKYLK